MDIKGISKEVLRNYRWNKFYQKELALTDTKKLKLVLGPARSGTTWVANTLSRTETPIVYLEEPLYQVLPQLKLAKQSDHTSIPFSRSYNSKLRLFSAYNLFCSPAFYSQYKDRPYIKRSDNTPEKVLVKEVHSLFATHKLIESLKCETILLLRDIKKTIDSLIYAQDFSTLYFQNEFSYAHNSRFLRYIGNNGSLKRVKDLHRKIVETGNSEQRILEEKTFTLLVVNDYFKRLASIYNNVRLYHYDEIIKEPDMYFEEMSAFLGIRYSKNQHVFKKSTSDEKVYDLNRSKKEILDRKYKYLNESQRNLIDNIIHEYKEITQ